MQVSIITDDDLCEIELIHKMKSVSLKSRRASREQYFSDFFIFKLLVKGLLVFLGRIVLMKF